MDYSRIEDFIINGDTDFNYYDQREYRPLEEDDYEELWDYLLYVAVKKYNFNYKEHIYPGSVLYSFIPDNFLQNCNSYEEAKAILKDLKDELRRHSSYNEVLKRTETHEERFFRNVTSIASNRFGGGIKIYESELSKKEYDWSCRLYIPCNDEYCFRFVRQLIQKSIENGLPFELKIMNLDHQRNGSDNIVLYVKASNLIKEIIMINEIVKENSDITFCKPHMFGYSINDHIAITPESPMSNTSYSGYIRERLKEYIKEYGKTSLCAKKIITEVNELFDKVGMANVIDVLSEIGLIDITTMQGKYERKKRQ